MPSKGKFLSEGPFYRKSLLKANSRGDTLLRANPIRRSLLKSCSFAACLETSNTGRVSNSAENDVQGRL